MRCPHCGGINPDNKGTIRCRFCRNLIDTSVSYSANGGVRANPYFAESVYEQYGKGVVVIDNEFGATGTGCILDTEGYILTNGHVVYSDKCKVSKHVKVHVGEHILVGEVVRANRPEGDNDVALVKIEPNYSYQALKVGSSRNLKIGQEVVAIGNSLGLGISVTKGIISETSMVIQQSKYILSDVSTNHGNSGGPLFNNDGEVIALCVAGFDGAKGMNLFIPIDHVKDILSNWGYRVK